MGILWAQFAALQLLISFIIPWPIVHAGTAATCDATTYGKPLTSDCTTLFQKFTEGQNLRTRLFVEEQLRAKPDLAWPGVDNTFEPPIVQVPKYYSMNTCNFAIMPYTNPNTHSMLPLGISSWGSIKISGTQLMAECLKKGSSTGGEVLVRDNTAKDPVLVIWMWASGANFEANLNQYENDPTFSPQLSISARGPTGVNRMNRTFTSAGAVPSAVIDTPVGPTLTSSFIDEMFNPGSIDTS